MALNTLSQGTPSAASQIPFYDTGNGQDRRCSVAQLAEAMQAAVTGGALLTQYHAPAATGWSVTVAPLSAGQSVWLLITPTAGFAAGAVTLPALATCVEGQEVLVTCTQAVTALTVAGNGATAVNGAPTTLAANGFFRLRFDAVLKSWFRIG